MTKLDLAGLSVEAFEEVQKVLSKYRQVKSTPRKVGRPRKLTKYQTK